MSEQLTRMRTMAERLITLGQEISHLEQQLQDTKAQHQDIEQVALPELMRELGFTSFALADGSRVALTEDLSCSITEANRDAALAWLDQNGFGGLIKTQVQVNFGREQRALAVAVARELEQRAGDACTSTVKESVHPGTLKAFLKDELAKGTAVPFELFNVYPFSKVKVALGR